MKTEKNTELEAELKAKALDKTQDSVSKNWHNLDNRLAVIAESAYFKSEKRGFQIGHEIEDWLEAERELAEIMGDN